MNEMRLTPKGVLYVITCASASAPRIPHFVEQAQHEIC